MTIGINDYSYATGHGHGANAGDVVAGMNSGLANADCSGLVMNIAVTDSYVGVAAEIYTGIMT